MIALQEMKRIFTGDNFSNLYEQSIVQEYLNSMSLENRYCVDIAASDGICMSNTYSLYRDDGVVLQWSSTQISFLSSQKITLGSRMSLWLNVW
jgi:hypothetical protein